MGQAGNLRETPDFVPGVFFEMPKVEWFGPIHYRLIQVDPPFAFHRHTGEVITPGPIDTDGGSIPRILWSVPGFSPWDYLPAYVIHDWLFFQHRKGEGELDFTTANLVLGEAMTTLQAMHYVPFTPRTIQAVYKAVSSVLGKLAWDGPWDSISAGIMRMRYAPRPFPKNPHD